MRKLYIPAIFIVYTFVALPEVFSQPIKKMEWDGAGVVKSATSTEGKELSVRGEIPLLTLVLDNRGYSITDAHFNNGEWIIADKLSIKIFNDTSPDNSLIGSFVFTNLTDDTLKLGNVVFLGASDGRHHITGFGDHRLSRTRLFRPGQSSVPVILPDNAWELGYSDVPVQGEEGWNICALIRRGSWKNAERRRFETNLHQGGTVTYKAYAEIYRGDWREGLKLVFQKRLLYDLETFDNTLYERDDLHWIRNQYVIHLMMAWDHWFYDKRDLFTPFQDFIDRGKKWYGGDDILGIWPTWPTLGIDQRNQWDHFRDLPGGTKAIRNLVNQLHNQDIKFFICYNPWDESTRLENHLNGMAGLIDELDADGVVLDTWGSSSYAIQRAADSVRSGVIMYSEGMAVPKDMPGIISGRVHNALYHPPLLNLNKLIKPGFAIFRVAELKYERIRREYNLSLFNGHGVEINMFSPGQPAWVEQDYKHLGKIARILRENSKNFRSVNFTPLVNSILDSVYINYWPGADKDLYTIYSLIPEGVDEHIFEFDKHEGQHLVDLWGHRELEPKDGRVKVRIEGFHKSWLGTNNEGAVTAIAVFPKILNVERTGNRLSLSAARGDSIFIWKGGPDYEKKALVLSTGDHDLRLPDVFPRYEGKLVVQLKDGRDLLDERIIHITPGAPILISKSVKSSVSNKKPQDMVRVKGGQFRWATSQGDEFISYPRQDTTRIHNMRGFFIDQFPVTNREFKEFLRQTSYRPEDDYNFLKHWQNGAIPDGQEEYPVVYISYSDAQAYAEWAGKRLPTELEWQYAAQTENRLKWPWGMEMDSTKTNMGIGGPYPVGQYPKGKNPLGIQDLVGQVWQMTQDVYESGSYTYNILKGGSYFKPLASWWYVQGGPQPLAHRQLLLMVSEGFDRKGTVGFRCVKDL